MTDRVKALTVVLEHDQRVDDVQTIISAIATLRGVLRVETHITDVDDFTAQARVRADLTARLLRALEQ